MRITYIGGNCGEGSPPWATENAYIDAFTKLGHEVTPIKQSQIDAARFVREPPDTQLVVYTRTHNPTALTPGWTDVWRRLEDRGIITASIHLDVFRGIPERERWVEEGDPLFTTGTVFTADGSMPEWWTERGVNHYWLPPAADLRHLDMQHRDFIDSLPKPTGNLDGKIVFVGSEGYHDCYPFRPKLVQHLRNTYGERFVFIGDGGQYGKMRMGPLAALYASDAVFVGDHCFATESRPRYWSDRLPETLGRGGFLLYPATPGMAEQGFIDGEHLICYEPGDLNDLPDWIDVALGMGSVERAQVREAGATMVKARHTYDHRAVTVLQTLGLAAQE